MRSTTKEGDSNITAHRNARWRTGVVAALVLLALAVVSATRRLDKHLQAILRQGNPGPQRVIVQTALGAGAAVANAADNQGRRAGQSGRRADQVGSRADLLAVTVSGDELAQLASRPLPSARSTPSRPRRGMTM